MQGVRPYLREKTIFWYPLWFLRFSNFFWKIFKKFWKWKFEYSWNHKGITMIWLDIWVDNLSPKNFSLRYGRSPSIFTLKKFFFSFFFTKDVILLVCLNHFPQYFLFICEKMSLLSWFWKDSCSVFDPISLVNENNDHFCTFIVKKCHFPCVSYACSTFKLKSFPLGFTFSFNNLIWIIKKYNFPCECDALFLIFLKTFVFHLICKYIFFHRDFKGKIKLQTGCPVAQKKWSSIMTFEMWDYNWFEEDYTL